MSLPGIIQRLAVPYLIMLSAAVVSLVAFASKTMMGALILNPYTVRRRGQIHRLLTAGWVHADLGHLITNMFVLYIFADRALETFGDLPFVIFYASAVVVAYIPTTLRFRNNPKYNSLGASGAVAAVMLSAIVVNPNMKLRLFFFPYPIPGVVFGALYILYSVWHSRGSDDNINHDAHFSGAVYGAIVTYLWAPRQVTQSVRVLIRFVDRLW